MVIGDDDHMGVMMAIWMARGDEPQLLGVMTAIC